MAMAAQVLDVVVRGGQVPADVPGTVDLEQGETFRPDSDGRIRQLTDREMSSAWITFKFALPKFD
jgi:hypothetical protein